ncbi:MAG: hypothetical protein JSU07_04325 [Bacteroidetes bacterium]|nr:hypothetical protein [Bacteroidota bacterium]
MHFKNKLAPIFIIIAFVCKSQNDVDALRYSRFGVNGTSRFVAMGGAFGAIGADASCAAYNPSGLGLYKYGDITYSGCLKFYGSNANVNGYNTPSSGAKFDFNNFGLVRSWQTQNDPESRHCIAFTISKVQNLTNTVTLNSLTKSSIATDMLLSAQKNKNNLDPSYEGLGYNCYLLDYDSLSGRYFSFSDTGRVIRQSRTISTTGKVNDLDLSYAYSFKDKIYFGLSVGFPRVQYSSTTVHQEWNSKDSMQIAMTGTTGFTSNYIEPLPFVYPNLLAYRNSSYTQYFTTSGGGINLKLGGTIRVNEFLRIGAYFHTPTKFTLTDNYQYSMAVNFSNSNSQTQQGQYPQQNGGTYSYTIKTPARFGLSAALVLGKRAILGIDYEATNYKNMSLGSSDGSFTGVNAVIASKYAMGNNLRVGLEYVLNSIYLRAGYNMQGSPFGISNMQNAVRNTISAGIGIKTINNFYVDLAASYMYTTEDYYLFENLTTKAKINYYATTISATIGFKFKS